MTAPKSVTGNKWTVSVMDDGRVKLELEEPMEVTKGDKTATMVNGTTLLFEPGDQIISGAEVLRAVQTGREDIQTALRAFLEADGVMQ